MMQTVTIYKPYRNDNRGGATEMRITLPAAPWDAPQAPKPAPPRAFDDPWRQSVVARPVMPPQPPRFDAMDFTPQQMIDAVARDAQDPRFKAMHRPMQRANTTVRSINAQSDTELRVIELLATPMTVNQLCAIVEGNRSTVRSVMDKLCGQKFLKKTKPYAGQELIYVAVAS